MPKLSVLRQVIKAAGVDPGEFDSVAQNGHLLAGLCAIFLPIALITPRWRWVGAGLIAAFAAYKEFAWDPAHEAPDVRGSSIEDFAYYCIGITVALGAYQIRAAFQ